MKRAALALVLAACSSSSNDFPPLPEGAGPGGASGGGGTVGDGGVGDGGSGGAGDAGRVISARVCIVHDLSNPTDCDPKGNASGVKVTLGTRAPITGPDPAGNFTIVAPSGTPVWHLTGSTFVPSVMLYGTDILLPIVPDTLYGDVQGGSGVTILGEGQGSVLARVVSNGAPVANVQVATTFTSTNMIPLYPTRNGLVWITTGPTLASGTVWFPGVDVTSVPGQITFTPQGGVLVPTRVDNVEQGSITFVTQDLP
ncbi:MAG TPA: hypothetical protein VF516_43310 [Kofleriaceae bacterium]